MPRLVSRLAQRLAFSLNTLQVISRRNSSEAPRSISSYSFQVTRRSSRTSGLISTSAISEPYFLAFFSRISVIGMIFGLQFHCDLSFRMLRFAQNGRQCLSFRADCRRGPGIPNKIPSPANAEDGMKTRGTTSIWRRLTAGALRGTFTVPRAVSGAPVAAYSPLQVFSAPLGSVFDRPAQPPRSHRRLSLCALDNLLVSFIALIRL